MRTAPFHVGLIPDGNRRWAQINGLTAAEGYAKGTKTFIALLHWCLANSVSTLSVFGSSHDNVKKRPKEEIQAMHAGALEICAYIIGLPQINVVLFGDIAGLPGDMHREEFLSYQYKADPADLLTVYIGLNYSDQIERQSAHVPDVDLLLRPGGRSRLSGFLPWQVSQAELYFVRDMWPDFTEDHFEAALTWYDCQKQTNGQ